MAQDFNLSASPTAVGSGARAMGLGNAFIAVADDATAASWNPGGLSQLERPELSLAIEGMHEHSDMRVSQHPEASGSHSFELADLNYLSLVYPFQRMGRNMVFSLNYLKQYRLGKDLYFHHEEVSGFGAPFMDINDIWMKQDGELTSLSPAFGVDVTDRLALGIAVNIWNHGVTGASKFRREVYQELRWGADGFFWVQETPSIFTSTYEVEKGYSVAIGALYRLSEEWTFGAVAKPAYKLRLDRDDRANLLYEDLDDVLEFPWVAGAGVAWRPSDTLTLSSDVTWTQWSEYTLYDDRYLEEENPRNPLNSGHSISEAECDDVFTCRFGMEYLIVREESVVPLRCGLAYDPGPAIDQIDEYYTASVGIGYQRGRFMADLAYELRWGDDTGTSIRGVSASQDSLRQRLLLSLIVYL
ncbi:MAG: hypothetical protein HN742_29570 [Lentisphaerae bacterium]|nr:hypothetical protein [Lentisphaerota bacterium]